MVKLTRIRRVAEDLEVSERIVHSWISKEILRCYHVGTLVFLDPDEVVEDIKAHAATHSPPKPAWEETEETPENG